MGARPWCTPLHDLALGTEVWAGGEGFDVGEDTRKRPSWMHPVTQLV